MEQKLFGKKIKKPSAYMHLFFPCQILIQLAAISKLQGTIDKPTKKFFIMASLIVEPFLDWKLWKQLLAAVGKDSLAKILEIINANLVNCILKA